MTKLDFCNKQDQTISFTNLRFHGGEKELVVGEIQQQQNSFVMEFWV